MLWNAKNLESLSLEAEDGAIGRCKDFLFDDNLWYVRYMVADTRKWLPGRKVLVSPISIDRPDPDRGRIAVKMTRQQIRESPPLDTDAPVSRRYERQWFRHHGWPPYWTGTEPWGSAPYPYLVYSKEMGQATEEQEEDPEETHLRSVKEVRGYDVRARDGDIGSVDDFIFAEPEWAIRYLVVDTAKWFQLRERKILLIPGCVRSVDWAEGLVEMNIDTADVKSCPEFSSEQPLERNFEIVLHDYYGWPKYWEKP